jgi:UDP-N-acetyl-2-amino-2-deoxyglucuronate dehydrogenase
MKQFVLLGAAGFVSPRHMKAIKDVGGNLLAALDPHDSVGVLDQYFPECEFFNDIEPLDRFCCKNGPDYVVVATPNYFHEAHCKFGLRVGADVICEKPVALTEKNIDGLSRVEQQTGKRVWNVLQCRYHPAIVLPLLPSPLGDRVKLTIDYVTPRGAWYSHSWKSDVSKSGGLATNIGVHLFDLAVCLYGKFLYSTMSVVSEREMAGSLELQSASVSWRLSIKMGETPKRMFNIDGVDYDLTTGFNDLHTKVYQEVLAGRGFGLDDARESIRICEAIRNQT